MPPPSPANLLLQAYATLAAGGRGLTWYTYYSGGYRYAPIDPNGDQTMSWSYLKMVNEQVKVIGPRMLKVTSTGVYFTSPPPAPGLLALPGKFVQSVSSAAPAMVGEFTGPNDQAWALMMNLSLRETAKFQIVPTDAAGGATTKAGPRRYVSPVDGSMQPLEPDNSLFLTPGQGVLIQLR
jgi:hypothetical protein